MTALDYIELVFILIFGAAMLAPLYSTPHRGVN